MLSLIYNGFRNVLSYAHVDKNKENIEDEIIARIEGATDTDVEENAHIEEDTDVEEKWKGTDVEKKWKDTDVEERKKDVKEQEGVLMEEGCYYKTGSITLITKDHVLIDGCYVYENKDDVTSNLTVGDKVYYSLYVRDSNAKPKVQKIIYVVNDTWDNANANSKKDIVHTSMIRRNIVAKVIDRKGRIAIVEPHNIQIDLSKIQSDFIPIIGDWLTIDALVELNNNSTDLIGEVLEVDKIKPLRSKLDMGVITRYDAGSECGVIDKRVIFLKRACDAGYVPRVGDKVVTESIESDQGHYNWRSITIVPLIEVREFICCIIFYIYIYT